MSYPRHSFGVILTLSRDAVGLFCSPRRLSWDYLVSHTGHSFGESNPSAEMLLMYTAAPADWTEIVLCHITDTRWRSLTPLQRCSRSILQTQAIGLRSFSVISRTLVEGDLLFSIDTVSVFCSPSRLGWHILVSNAGHSFKVLPLCRDAVGVFCSLS